MFESSLLQTPKENITIFGIPVKEATYLPPDYKRIEVEFECGLKAKGYGENGLLSDARRVLIENGLIDAPSIEMFKSIFRDKILRLLENKLQVLNVKQVFLYEGTISPLKNCTIDQLTRGLIVDAEFSEGIEIRVETPTMPIKDNEYLIKLVDLIIERAMKFKQAQDIMGSIKKSICADDDTIYYGEIGADHNWTYLKGYISISKYKDI